ncbi:transmembrane amino acid transporter protein-domain-containing protein [Clohesyomyces aquaticus]|uniref:Transmembrane amino acid transporter protein-domain-containing protein n=1 Tax=Clohesyomyces aquaticus TaxID=1231657 RepID=A0A1Y1Z8R0_9PLEO|nr:transmembrane amino acid transporter protein-domain-containing protein [Clohesyomyces aquaticus]
MALGFGSKAEKVHSPSSSDLEKKSEIPDQDVRQPYDAEEQGGRRHRRRHPGRRIDRDDDSSSDRDSLDGLTVGKQIEMEADNAIKYRTCSWPKTAALLFSEYICLAIMSFPYSYSVLGLVPGLILTFVVAGLVLYTSLIVWEFCMRHPEVRDVCDLGQMLFFNSRAAWWFTAVMFILNNTFIQGFHCLVGAKYLNTMTNHSLCTIGFSAIVAVISWACSLPRTFSTLAKIATFSAFFTFISVLLATIFAGIEDHPKGYPEKGEPTILVIPAAGTTFVAGMNAFMNISYTFIGQITIPSFIAEMKQPRDFPKALWAVTIAEVIVFSLVGAIVYAYTGTNYNTAPAFGSLGNELYLKVSFSFMIPTLIFLGVLYASVSARFIFFRMFHDTRHMSDHTVLGWAAWAGVLAVLWFFAFLIAEVIPFFSDLLSLMSSLFDSFFGFIFWGVAYIRMRRADYGSKFYSARGFASWFGFIFNVILCLIGLLFLTAGTYASVQSIIDGYHTSTFGGAFSCENNGL